MPRREEYEEYEEERPRRQMFWKAAGVLLLLVFVYWFVVGGGFNWAKRLSGKAEPTARLSQTGEVCVSGALPISVSCGEACGSAIFQKVGWSYSCSGGQLAVLRDLRPHVPTTFTFPGGNITILFPAVDVEVPLVQTREAQIAKASTPEIIVPPVLPSPTPEPSPQVIPVPIKVISPVKRPPAHLVRQPIQVKSSCSIALSFTVNAMFASSPCLSGTAEWGSGSSTWHKMKTREVGGWHESALLPPPGSRICFRVNKKAYCASNVKGGGTYSFISIPR